MLINHTFEPVYDKNSRILILGTLPSVKSRETGFYYGHSQNRFWKVLAAVFNENTPVEIEEKKAFLLKNRIAIWDVISSCEIDGSSDASIKNVLPNDIGRILAQSDIQRIYANGKTAEKLYNRYVKIKTTDNPALPAGASAESQPPREIIPLPSTSPANAAYSLDRLISAWKVIAL